MSVGLGIFLGCVFLGSIFLYLKTANSWNWKKIGRRILMAVGVLFGGGILIAGGMVGYEKWEQRPRVVTSLEGIAVGEKLSDVIFKHGPFEKEEKQADSIRKYQDEEQYRNKDKNLSISVRAGIVGVVYYGCNKETDYTSMNKISCRDSGDKISELFGDKVRILCATKKDEYRQFLRVYDVVAYGTRYLLWQNEVRTLIIADKKELESFVGVNWDKCD